MKQVNLHVFKPAVEMGDVPGMDLTPLTFDTTGQRSYLTT